MGHPCGLMAVFRVDRQQDGRGIGIPEMDGAWMTPGWDCSLKNIQLSPEMGGWATGAGMEDRTPSLLPLKHSLAFGALENSSLRGLPSPDLMRDTVRLSFPEGFVPEGRNTQLVVQQRKSMAHGQKVTGSSLQRLVYSHVTEEATFPVMTKPAEKQRCGGNVHYLLF